MELLLKRNTGNPKELSKKLGISERMLFRYLESLKSKNIQIEYCKKRRTYLIKDLKDEISETSNNVEIFKFKF